MSSPVRRAPALVIIVAAMSWLAGCAHPFSAEKMPASVAYREATATALDGKIYSSATRLVLHRFDLLERFKKNPAETLQWLHDKAQVDDRRDLMFALAELSYLHGETLHRNRRLKPWEPRLAQDYFLCSTIYAYIYLASHDRQRAELLDPKVSVAVSLYNRALSRGFVPASDTNGIVVLAGGLRKLPPGTVKVEFSQPGFPWDLKHVDHFLAADDFVVHGLTVRNQENGLGAPLIGIGSVAGAVKVGNRVPATIFLRAPGDLKQWSAGQTTLALELYSGYDKPTVEVAGRTLPLRTDTTAPLAHALNQDYIWRIGASQFFSAEQKVKTGVYPTQPYQPGRVPVVFVHGTFSSPIWWAEMWNTLRADPVLRERCQFWSYVYNSGNALVYSGANFRESLTNIVHRFDPGGKDPAMQQMVLIGHSQGGLLAKMAVTDPGDRLWRSLTDKSLDDLKLPADQLSEIERGVFFSSLPFVKRVVFVSTPHRGSFMATSFVRKFAARFMSLPGELLRLGDTISKVIDKRHLPPEMHGLPTSLDGMSPKNPLLLELARIPPAPGVKAHSIIAVKGDGDPETGDDGVVKYQSAHLDYAVSELVVRSGHSCQDKPPTIEEVRRILLEHLNSNELQKPGLRPQ